jgi:hypothetical protein
MSTAAQARWSSADMSLYEVLAVVVLVGVGGFAYHLYRKDTRPREPGAPAPSESGEPMFARTKNKPDTRG